MSGHPKDIWVEITGFSSATPEYLLAIDGREAEINEARDLYVHDRIDIVELERKVETALRT